MFTSFDNNALKMLREAIAASQSDFASDIANCRAFDDVQKVLGRHEALEWVLSECEAIEQKLNSD